jgi:flagellar protein FliS
MALAGNPYKQYQEQAVRTASPDKLIIMLFDGALRFSGKAKNFISEKNFENAGKAIYRCEDIIDYLINTLNPKIPIAAEIEKMYEYIQYNFVQANITKDVSYLEEAEKYLRDFRETWKQVGEIVRDERSQIKQAL